MLIPAAPTKRIFDNALNAALEIGTTRLPDGLTANMLADLSGRLERIWGDVVAVLDQAFEIGKAQAQAALQASMAKLEELFKEAGNRALELKDIIMQRLRAFIRSFLQGVLSLMPAAMDLEGSSLKLDKMSYTQHIKLGGSLKASLESLCELIAEGEMEVEFEYSAPGVK